MPAVLIFAASGRTVDFNMELRGLFFLYIYNEDLTMSIGAPVFAGLYSEPASRSYPDTEEAGFRLLLPFALRPYMRDVDGARMSDGQLVRTGSFTELFQHGWFHTGDLGYVDKDGYVFIVGRIKEMINRGGEKISPYEVEDVIRQIPVVKEAAVIGVPHPLYGETVVSYIVCHDGQESIEEISMQVMEHCQQSLSSFKCPAEVYIVDELPVGPTGKIQRSKLKEISIEVFQNLNINQISGLLK